MIGGPLARNEILNMIIWVSDPRFYNCFPDNIKPNLFKQSVAFRMYRIIIVVKPNTFSDTLP